MRRGATRTGTGLCGDGSDGRNRSGRCMEERRKGNEGSQRKSERNPRRVRVPYEGMHSIRVGRRRDVTRRHAEDRGFVGAIHTQHDLGGVDSSANIVLIVPIIATSHWVKAFPKIGTRRGSGPGRRTTRPLLHPRIEPKDLDGDLDTTVEDVDGRRDSPGSPSPTNPHPPTRGWEILAIHVSKTIYKTDLVPRNPSIPRSKFPKPSHFCNAILTDRKRETIESRLIGTNPCVVSCFGPCFGPAKARTFRPSLPRCARPGRGLFARTRQEGPTSST